MNQELADSMDRLQARQNGTALPAAIDISGMNDSYKSMRKQLPAHARAAFDKNWASAQKPDDLTPRKNPTGPTSALLSDGLTPIKSVASSKRPAVPDLDDVNSIRSFVKRVAAAPEDEALSLRAQMLSAINGYYPELGEYIAGEPVEKWPTCFVIYQAAKGAPAPAKTLI